MDGFSSKTAGIALFGVAGALLVVGMIGTGSHDDTADHQIHAATTADATRQTPAVSAQASAPIDFDKDQFGARVRDYLLENPGVIMEAVAALEAQEKASQTQNDVGLIAALSEEIYNDGFSWVGGNPDGDVTVVEFLDYRCGYCRKAHPEVAELIEEDGNIRLIVKELPVLGEESVTAARFAVAAKIVAGDEAYAKIHEGLMTLPSTPSEAVMSRLASTLGYDSAPILAEMNSAEVTRRLNATRELAGKLQINGTPGFVMAGTMMRGYAPVDVMRSFVEEARAVQ